MKKILKVFKSKTPSSKSSTSASTAPATESAAASSTAPTATTAATTETTSAPAPANTNTNMAGISTADFFKATGYRHSVYPLSDKVEVSDDRIIEIVQEALKVAPSAYNSQPMRVAIFLGSEHKKFWGIIKDNAMPLLQHAGNEVVAAMTQRFAMFTGAYGTISFWADEATVKQSQETHAASAAMFPQWSEHANGMLQFQVWTAVELEGLGANLQHMNAFPPAEAALKQEFSLPETWSLKANLNIGGETAPHPSNPEKKPFTETIKVFKS